MAGINPCDTAKNLALQQPDLEQCLAGADEFHPFALAFISVRHALGRLRIQKGSEKAVKAQEDTLKDYKDRFTSMLDAKKQGCDSGDMRFCGFVNGYEHFVKYFGPIDVWKTASDRSVEVPMKPNRSFVVIPAGDGKTNEEMIFDTGTNSAVFSEGFFKQHSGDFTLLPQKNSLYNIPIYQSGISFHFGKLNYKPVSALISGILDYLEGSDVNNRLVSILGMDVLQDIGFKVDFDKSRFTLAPDVEASLKKGKWFAVPAEIKFGDTSFTMSIPLTVNGQEGTWLLDTGDTLFSTLRTCAKHIPDLQTGDVGTGMDVVGEHRVNEGKVSVRVGNKTLDGVRMTIMDDDTPGNKAMLPDCGAVGIGVLQNFNLIFDHGTFTLYMQPRSNMPVQHDSGIRISPKRVNGKIVAETVAGGVAEKAGLKSGDVIEKVNGVDTERISILEFGEFTFKTFNVDRNGQKLTIKIR